MAAGYVTVVFAGEMELRLGEPTELEEKLQVAADILEQYTAAGKTLAYINATVPERVAVKPK